MNNSNLQKDHAVISAPICVPFRWN